MTHDLALLAERRGGLAALLGMLLLEEPDEGLLASLATAPRWAAFATGDGTRAPEFERVLLRGVPMYEHAFRSSTDRERGGVTAAVIEAYERAGFSEYRDGRWRVAGPDHLGLELRCLAHLCRDEAEAWRSGAPDRAVEAVEAERRLLAQHVAAWAPVALDAATECAGNGVYAPVLAAVTEFLSEEIDRLRPAPDLGDQRAIDALPRAFGTARLAYLLATPATCGTWLSRETIAAAARAVGVPLRPSDPRSALRRVIEAAESTGELGTALEPIVAAVGEAVERHRRRAAEMDGNAAHDLRWAAVAGTAHDRLVEIARDGLACSGAAEITETLTIGGPDGQILAEVIDTLIEDLHGRGLRVTRAERPMEGAGGLDVARVTGSARSLQPRRHDLNG